MSEAEAEKTTIKTRFTRIVGRLPTDDWLVIGWVLLIKIALFIFGAKAVLVLANKRLPSNLEWLRTWKHWDTLHYLEVAKSGYTKGALLMAYPLYPWLIRFVTWLARDYYFSALIISAVALVFAAILLRRLVCLDFSAAVAERAVWFFLIFPTAYFLHIAYTESLFLALVLAAFFAVRKEKWWIGGALGVLAAMTRANGLALVPAFVVEAAQQWRIARKWRWQWLWIVAIPLGFCVYLAVNQHVSGNAFGFVEMRRQVFRTFPDWPWIGIREAYRNLQRKPGDAEMVGSQELFFVFLSLGCSIVSWFKLRPSYSTWITFNWLGFAGLSFIQSAPRYTLVLFPIFILFGLFAQTRFWNGVITIWSLLFFALFASLFARGWWAF